MIITKQKFTVQNGGDAATVNADVPDRTLKVTGPALVGYDSGCAGILNIPAGTVILDGGGIVRNTGRVSVCGGALEAKSMMLRDGGLVDISGGVAGFPGGGPVIYAGDGLIQMRSGSFRAGATAVPSPCAPWQPVQFAA